MTFEDVARSAYAEHPNIIEKWKTSPDPVERALASVVLEAAGVSPCD